MILYHFMRRLNTETGESTLSVTPYECKEGAKKYSMHHKYGHDLLDKDKVDKVLERFTHLDGDDLYTFNGDPSQALKVFNMYYAEKIKEYQHYIESTVYDETEHDF